MNSEIDACGAPTHLGACGRQYLGRRSRLTVWGPAESKNPSMFPRRRWQGGAHREVRGRTPMMDEQGKSDRPVVPTKPANKPGELDAEPVEGRGLAKGNPSQGDTASDAGSRARATGAGAGTAGSRAREGGEVHGALASRLRGGHAAGSVFQVEARCCGGG